MAPVDNSHLSKINPEFEAVLKTTPQHGHYLGDIPALREAVLTSKRKLTASLPKPEGVTKCDITVPARDGFQIPVRVHSPEASTSGSPLVVFMHGGGFCLGSVENEEVLCNLFVQAHGATVLNVDHRLAPEHKFPQAVEDVWDVTQWAAKHASDLKADLSEGFIIGGVSSGANLAAVMSHLARDENLSPAFTGIYLLMPVLADQSNVSPEHKEQLQSFEEHRDAPVLSARLFEQLIGNYEPDPKSHLWNLFAPPVKFDNLPPTYLSILGLDPLRDEGLLYERLLREEHGCKTKLEVYPGLPHAFYSNFPDMEVSKAYVKDAVSGLGWLLGKD